MQERAKRFTYIAHVEVSATRKILLAEAHFPHVVSTANVTVSLLNGYNWDSATGKSG
jgi:hypothetical protein